MKIEKLTEDQIKITITIDDLASRNIDLYSFMYNSPESQDLFWDVMNEAERDYGFNVDNSMIYVEASTTGGGNFTLIVTKTDEKPTINFNTSKKKAKMPNKIKLKRKKSPMITQNSIYEFSSFDDICGFCKIIDTSILSPNSLYKLNDTYFLKASSMPYTSIIEHALVCKNFEVIDAKLGEYGEIIIKDNALQTISKYFNNQKKKKSKRTENR